jgi:hypothetical protein
MILVDEVECLQSYQQLKNLRMDKTKMNMNTTYILKLRNLILIKHRKDVGCSALRSLLPDFPCSLKDFRKSERRRYAPFFSFSFNWWAGTTYPNFENANCKKRQGHCII